MTHRYQVRIVIIFFLFCALYGIILFNLYYIQIRNTHFFAQLGSQQYNVSITQTPLRASIYDRTGKRCLAMNKDCLSAFILPSKLSSPQTLYPFLAEHFPHALDRLKKQPHKHFMYIKRRLNTEQEALMAKANIPDIQLLHETSRFYSIESAGPVVGLTDIDNNGILGVELQYNNKLSGLPTTYSLEKDARSGFFYFNKQTKEPGIDGLPITLTIDSNLQFLTHEELAHTIAQFNAKEGAVVIMVPTNGEILSMVSVPHFDLNNTEQINLEQTKNKIITEAYELGSVIKVFAALAALEEKVVTSDELIDCKNKLTAYIDGRRINTVLANGIIPFYDVMRRSNNIGIAQVAKRLDSTLYDHYKRIGFGQKTDIAFPGQARGYINPPETWSKQSIFSLSYGYEISISLLQLACAFCMIANNGYKVNPILLLDAAASQPDLGQSQIYTQESIDAITEILQKTTPPVIANRAQKNGYTIMSKTGTANMLIDGKYDPTQNIYTCGGIIQKGDYKRVIVTFVKQAKYKNLFAATVAAPLFEKIAQKLLIHERII